MSPMLPQFLLFIPAPVHGSLLYSWAFRVVIHLP